MRLVMSRELSAKRSPSQLIMSHFHLHLLFMRLKSSFDVAAQVLNACAVRCDYGLLSLASSLLDLLPRQNHIFVE